MEIIINKINETEIKLKLAEKENDKNRIERLENLLLEYNKEKNYLLKELENQESKEDKEDKEDKESKRIGNNNIVNSFVFIKISNVENNSNIQTIFPNQTPDNYIQEIISRSIPLKPSPTAGNLFFQYPIVLRNEEDFEKPFLYGYVSYKQIATLPPSTSTSPSTLALTSTMNVGDNNDFSDLNQNQEVLPNIQQQAYVMISHLPIPSIAYRVLNILESAHMNNLSQFESKSSSSNFNLTNSENSENEKSINEIFRLFSMAFDKINRSWPSLDISRGIDGSYGLDVVLPFFSQNLFFKLSIPSVISGIELNSMLIPTETGGISLENDLTLSKISLGSSILFSGKLNFISIFGPYGLIPHLWTIWELLVQGADFIVCGKDPQNVSEVVLALSSLVVTPLELYSSRGYYVKPFVSRNGPLQEIKDIVRIVKQRKENALSNQNYTAHMEGSFIVGITDPTLLLDFKDFTTLISIPEKSQFNNSSRFIDEMAVESFSRFNPKFIAPMRYFTKEDLDSDAASNLTYTSSRLMYEDIQASINGTDDKKLESKSEDINDQSNRLSSNSTTTPTRTTRKSKSLKDNPEKLIPSFFSRTYVSWVLLTEKMNVYTPGLVVFPYLPHVSPIQEIVYKKLIKLTEREYLNKGDEILREHFNQLTGSFFHSLMDNEHSNLNQKFITFSLIQSIGDRLIPPYDLTSKPVTISCQMFDIAFGMSHWNLKAIDRNGAEHVWEVINMGRALSKIEPLVVEKLPIGVKTTQRLPSGRVITSVSDEQPSNGIVVNKSINELDEFIINYAKGKNFHIFDSKTWNCQRFTSEVMWWATNSLDNIPIPKINQDPYNMALDPWGNEKPNRGTRSNKCIIS